MESTAGSGTLLLILIQITSRAFTFVGNQFLLRFLSPTLLGISVQLELVSVTSLYFARDSLRVALQRAHPSRDDGDTAQKNVVKDGIQTQTVVNLSYLAVALGVVVSVIFGWSYLSSAPSEVLHTPYFDISFKIYILATLAELAAEPSFVVIQQEALYKDRARAETLAAMARCLVACLTALLGRARGWSPSILPFAAGQAAYAVLLFTLYLLPVLRSSRKHHFNLTPRVIPPISPSASPEISTSQPPSSSRSPYYLSLLHVPTLHLAATMYMQSVFKLLLTQGDAFILSLFSSLSDQGAFALVSNYGGLLARLVLQPVEESSRNVFGRLLSSTPVSPKRSSTTSPKSRSIDLNSRFEALKHLTTVLHIYLLVTLPLLSIAPAVLPWLTPYLLPPTWRSPATTSLLGLYVYYVPLSAINGILDAFVTSVATPSQLRRQSLWMAAFTSVYAGAAWLFLSKFEMGARGLVLANMVNMAARALWGLRFVRYWVQENVDAAKAGGEEQKGVIANTANLWRDACPSFASVCVAGFVGTVVNGHGILWDLNGSVSVSQRLGGIGAGAVLLATSM